MSTHITWACPKCGHKMRQVDQLVTADDERMRRKECPACGKTIFTLEFKVDKGDWDKEYKKYYRQKRTVNKEYHRRHGETYVEQAI